MKIKNKQIVAGLKIIVAIAFIATVVMMVRALISAPPPTTTPQLIRPKVVQPGRIPMLGSKPVINFDVLADVIKIHENSKKFPYGCHVKRNGKFIGFPEPVARAKCIKICKKVYEEWDGKSNYFVHLNKHYAEDTRWHKSVQSKYTKRMSL